MDFLGDYQTIVEQAEALIVANGIDVDELIQCDTLCYRVETHERYDELKSQLTKSALLLSEVEINGRPIAVFMPSEPLAAGRWKNISYIELPAPKLGSLYPEGIDHLQFVTRQPLSQFHKAHAEISFDTKGLAHRLNPLIKLEGEQVSVKFHDKHMGSVVELETAFAVH